MGEESLRVPLVEEAEPHIQQQSPGLHLSTSDLPRKFWIESKALWRIAGASIVSRIATNGLYVITQAFVGHLGDLELAAFSIVTSVIVGLTSGLLIGMGNAVATLCGQAYGAKKQHMMGIYTQRSWIVISGIGLAILPVYIFTAPLLKLLGQPDNIAGLAFKVSLRCIPLHFAFVFYYTLSRFLLYQTKNVMIVWPSLLGAVFNVLLCWLLVAKLKMGLDGAIISLTVGWWTPVIVMYIYTTCGWCPDTWTGFSREAFADLWPFFKLSVASGVMLCLEIWYYRVLVLMTGSVKNIEVAVDSLSICINIDSWEMAIPLGFLAATGVRVANEIGAGRPQRARFAVIVSVVSSTIIGVVLLVLILVLRSDFAKIFTDNATLQTAVYRLTILLAFTVLLNSVQPILLGCSIGLGRQVSVAYITAVCYYVIGVPLGFVLGHVFHLGVKGIWIGMIGGTAAQTVVLTFITWRTDWDMEAKRIASKVQKWSTPKPSTQNKKDIDSCYENIRISAPETGY